MYKDKFSLEDHITYLNMAYMSPLLKSVEAVGREAVSRKARPYTITPEDFFVEVNELKRQFAQLVEVEDDRRMAVIPSVSYGLANVANNLRPGRGDEIVLVAEQFPSNVYPWMNLAKNRGAALKIVDPPNVEKDRAAVWNQHILDAINERTVMVALPHVHWADGTRFDLLAIREATKACGALLVIDGTQSVGALPFSVASIQPDALICAGYKWLLGPYSIGMAYYGEYFDPGQPVEENWINRLHAEDFSGLVNYEPRYGPKAQRYNVGEHSNFILVPMMSKALAQIREWTVPLIQDHCARISAEGIQALQEIGCHIEAPEYRGHHLFGVRFPARFDIEQLKLQLRDANIFVSFRGNSMRVSPYLYNDVSDFERLIQRITAH